MKINPLKTSATTFPGAAKTKQKLVAGKDYHPLAQKLIKSVKGTSYKVIRRGADLVVVKK